MSRRLLLRTTRAAGVTALSFVAHAQAIDKTDERRPFPVARLRKLSKAEIQEFREQGFLVVKQLIVGSELEYLRSSAVRAWNETKGDAFKFDDKRTWLENALLPNIHHLSRAVYDYYLTGPLVSIATQLIGNNIKVNWICLRFPA